MARRRNLIPSYRGKNGRGVFTVRDAYGNRRDVLLPGLYGSEESHAEYERQLAILRASGGHLPETKASGDPTIAELMVKYIEEHVEGYYPGQEKENIKLALRPLKRLFANLPAREFGPLSLRTVRAAALTGSWMTADEITKRAKHGHAAGLARTTCNRSIGRIKAMFRWAVEMELKPPSVLHGLQAVQGLRKGRSGARETKPVLPVHPDIVQATLPHMPFVTRDVASLQLLTGMRAGEVCAMKGDEIDRAGEVWVYSPSQHKTAILGHRQHASVRHRPHRNDCKNCESNFQKSDAARFVARLACDFLKTQGFTDAVLIDSVNGTHCYWPIDLPNTAASSALVKDFLLALRGAFSPLIDPSVHDARCLPSRNDCRIERIIC